MEKTSKTTPVKDGWIKRDTRNGRIMEVRTSKGVAKASAITRVVVKDASSKRSAALKRLANR